MKGFWVLVVAGLLLTVASADAQMWRWDPLFDKEIPELSPGSSVVGDVNSDGLIGPKDVDTLISYLFTGGEIDTYSADVNRDGSVDEHDVMQLIDSIYPNTLPEKYSSIINSMESDELSQGKLRLMHYFKRIDAYERMMDLRSNNPIYFISWIFCGQVSQERTDSNFISDHANELKTVPYILLESSKDMERQEVMEIHQIIQDINNEIEKMDSMAETKIRNAGGICG